MATYVLIPGAGGEAWYWHLVVPLLEAAGHRAVAVDLPASDPEAGLDAYVAAALDAVGSPESEVVVVGQSLGGPVPARGAAADPHARDRRHRRPLLPGRLHGRPDP